MSLVRIKGKYQITIPAELRERIDLEISDLLEATVEGNKIILSPKKVVDSEPPIPLQEG